MTMTGPVGARVTHLVVVQFCLGHNVTLFVRLSACVGPNFVLTVCQMHTHHARVEFGRCGSNDARSRNKTFFGLRSRNKILFGLRQTREFVQAVVMLC